MVVLLSIFETYLEREKRGDERELQKSKTKVFLHTMFLRGTARGQPSPSCDIHERPMLTGFGMQNLLPSMCSFLSCAPQDRQQKGQPPKFLRVSKFLRDVAPCFHLNQVLFLILLPSEESFCLQRPAFEILASDLRLLSSSMWELFKPIIPPVWCPPGLPPSCLSLPLWSCPQSLRPGLLKWVPIFVPMPVLSFSYFSWS